MPIWAKTLASARPFCSRIDGIGRRDNGPVGPGGSLVAWLPGFGACEVEVTPPILGGRADGSAIR
ncbi:hypothetical protein GCM10009570_16920 [Dietzia natronolimnaea]